MMKLLKLCNIPIITNSKYCVSLENNNVILKEQVSKFEVEMKTIKVSNQRKHFAKKYILDQKILS